MTESPKPRTALRSAGRPTAATSAPGEHRDARRDRRPNRQQAIYREFGRLEIGVATRRDELGEQLIRELQRTRARVHHLWPPPAQFPTTLDVIYCDLLPDLPQRLPWIPGESSAALVVIVPPNQPLDLGLLENSAPHAMIYSPITVQAVVASLTVAMSHFSYERRLRHRIEKLDDNLRTMRSVERAKTILMRTKNLREDEAYKHLRRQAMERRVTIGALATAIVDSQELIG